MFNRVAFAASTLLFCGTSLGQSWNNLRNDYRIQESNGFAYLYSENGVTDYMPRLTMEIWNVDYLDWNPNSQSRLYAVGHQMQPSAPTAGWDNFAQSAICRWTAPYAGEFVIRFRAEKNSPVDGNGVVASAWISGVKQDEWSLNRNGPAEFFGSYAVDFEAGDSFSLRVDPTEITAQDAVNFEIAVFGPCQADLNHDGIVDDSDFVAFVFHYDRMLSVGADFNDDGLTEDSDFVDFAAAYDALLCD